MLTIAAADTLQLVLAAAVQQPRITSKCLEEATQSCLQIVCALAPLAFDKRYASLTSNICTVQVSEHSDCACTVGMPSGSIQKASHKGCSDRTLE